jgi:hypothetical protein
MAKLTKHPPGYPVVFTNPTTGEPVQGQIVDEVWATEPDEFGPVASANDGWREGAFVAQLIEWPDGYRSVRITYYLRPDGTGPDTWYFGGQYSASMGLDEYHSLIGKLQQKHW